MGAGGSRAGSARRRKAGSGSASGTTGNRREERERESPQVSSALAQADEQQEKPRTEDRRRSQTRSLSTGRRTKCREESGTASHPGRRRTRACRAARCLGESKRGSAHKSKAAKRERRITMPVDTNRLVRVVVDQDLDGRRAVGVSSRRRRGSVTGRRTSTSSPSSTVMVGPG